MGFLINRKLRYSLLIALSLFLAFAPDFVLWHIAKAIGIFVLLVFGTLCLFCMKFQLEVAEHAKLKKAQEKNAEHQTDSQKV